MKKILISNLIIFSFLCNALVCFASDDFDYGVNKTTDVSFNDVFTINDYANKTTISTTIDFVPLFNRSLIVPIKKIFLL